MYIFELGGHIILQTNPQLHYPGAELYWFPPFDQFRKELGKLSAHWVTQMSNVKANQRPTIKHLGASMLVSRHSRSA